jgi:hypothetical protein
MAGDRGGDAAVLILHAAISEGTFPIRAAGLNVLACGWAPSSGIGLGFSVRPRAAR